MKSLIESIIRRRNPHFKFGEDVNLREVIEIAWIKFVAMLRAYKVLLRFRNPGKLFLGRYVRFYGIHNITWGKWVQIGDNSVLSAYGKTSLRIGNNVSLGAFSRFIVSSSLAETGEHIIIGNNVGIGDFCHIGGGGGVEIGDDCIIGSYFSCHPSNHNFSDSSKLIRLQGVSRKGIKVGANCWIGAKVSILDGVEVGNNCVIAAGSVVNKSIPSGTVVGGVPAKFIKQIL